MDDGPAVPGQQGAELAGLSVLHQRLAGAQHDVLEQLVQTVGAVLGDAVRVERRGLFNSGRAKALAITLGDQTFELREERGQLRALIGHTVGGVVLSRQPTPIEAWIAQLIAALDTAARHSDAMRAALSRLT